MSKTASLVVRAIVDGKRKNLSPDQAKQLGVKGTYYLRTWEDVVSDLGATARTPAAGVACATAHSLGNRVLSAPAPAVPDISVWKKMHAAYQQRSTAQK